MIERTAIRRAEHRRALYSHDEGGPDGFGDYRMLLEIVWDPRNHRRMLSVGLNPSTASHVKNDPTLTRDCGFARDMGFGGVIKVNLADIRATDPKEMLRAASPISPENTAEWLASIPCDLVVASWGAHGAHKKLREQAAAVRAAFGDRLHAFMLCSNSEPHHELYLPARMRPVPMHELRGTLERVVASTDRR